MLSRPPRALANAMNSPGVSSGGTCDSTLSISTDPSGQAAGVYWGVVTLQNGTQTTKVSVRLEVY